MAVLHLRIIILLVMSNLHKKADMVDIKDAHQISEVITVSTGDKITLNCFFPEKYKNDILYWYKQLPGHKPFPVVMWQNHAETRHYKDFNDVRFSVKREDLGLHLVIANTKTSDEALYFCGVNDVFELHFLSGTFVVIKGKKLQSSNLTEVIQFPVSGVIYPGDSVIMNCTVLTEISTEDLQVFWFKAAEDDSHPGLIYTNINRSSQCERGYNYSLTRTKLSLTDTGTYYCAISACGEILFGNGTVLNIREPVSLLVHSLGVAVGLFASLIGLLVCINCKKTTCQHSQGASLEACGVQSLKEQRDYQDTSVDMPNYAALHFSDTKTKRGRKKREQQQDTVYSGVKYSVK